MRVWKQCVAVASAGIMAVNAFGQVAPKLEQPNRVPVVAREQANIVKAEETQLGAEIVVEQPALQTVRVFELAADQPLPPQPAQLRLDGVPGQVAMEKAAFLGVGMGTLDAAEREKLKLAKRVGLAVQFVEPGSPAQASGIKAGDALEKLNDQLIIDPYQFSVLVRSFNAGDVIKLTVARGAERIVIDVKLAERDLPELADNRPMGNAQGNVIWKNAITPQDILVNGGALALDDFHGKLGDQIIVAPRGAPMMLGVAADGRKLPRLPQGRLDLLTWSDEEHTFSLSSHGDAGTRELDLVVKTLDGTILFDGPISTDEQRKALPKDVAEKLEAPGVKPIIDMMNAAAAPNTDKGTKGEKVIKGKLEKF